MQNHPIAKYRESVGITQREMAAIIGVSIAFVTHIETYKRQVPAKRCPDIEKATNGQVRCEDLRPDIDWSVLRSTKNSTA